MHHNVFVDELRAHRTDNFREVLLTKHNPPSVRVPAVFAIPHMFVRILLELASEINPLERKTRSHHLAPYFVRSRRAHGENCLGDRHDELAERSKQVLWAEPETMLPGQNFSAI